MRHIASKMSSSQKITYPLVTMMLSQEQCNHIMRPLLQTGLAKGGIICTIPRAVVHGLLHYGGLDLPNLLQNKQWCT